ncbi:MAG: hypothetical protein ACD_65C00233G0001 [uncultured bacterium]|nr:MAG: hypothetical protein ACD_65C00233G0001 [uncultured bacterium]KKT02491.1 MAG: orotidine 5'-phosphate decarboxylase, orotidine-5'-phosphate decarboxylase [Candidatus Peregrinibacteria bacterium GW2011_GWF2_43_17]KKT19749.1 MAG: Orotidine 5'-phosphate decarboxylase [Candidatus Peregrinibacteria bacterium GW2011_GWA2_43_8]HAU40214.1 orotidine-5'-phosphate decarboxylase [Candidatus Peregrinibacteria bacterium]
MNFADKLIAAIKAKGNPICVGLDPRMAQMPTCVKKGSPAETFLEFNKGIIDAVADLVPVVKPQIAFYEQYGSGGYAAFEKTCEYAQSKGLLVIADAKRNDIGSTAEGYAEAFLSGGAVKADAVTVTPYLGYDGVKPFIEACKKYGKGIFVLVKTSNKSSGELQDCEVVIPDGKLKVYEMMGHFVESWGADEISESGYSSVGAVVGATFPDQARVLRKIMPKTIFLVPGYGAQGGGVVDVKPCFNKDGLGAIVNSSRGIIFAYEGSKHGPDGYKDAARDAVKKMAKELQKAI